MCIRDRIQPVGPQVSPAVALGHGRLVGGDVIELLRRGERPPGGRTPRTWSGSGHASILAQPGQRRTGHDDGFLSRPTSNGGFALNHWPHPSLTRRDAPARARIAVVLPAHPYVSGSGEASGS